MRVVSRIHPVHERLMFVLEVGAGIAVFVFACTPRGGAPREFAK